MFPQVRSKISTFGGFGGPTEVTCGGNALKFYASVRLNIKRIGLVKKGEEVQSMCSIFCSFISCFGIDMVVQTSKITVSNEHYRRENKLASIFIEFDLLHVIYTYVIFWGSFFIFIF